MASHTHENSHAVQAHPADPKKIRKIWMTMVILAIVTAIEFLMAFTLPKGVLLTTLFVLLTFVKTFYIVGEFMHLKYEVKSFVWTICAPTLFIVWLILSMLIEGDSVLSLRYWINIFFK
ncbi:MAG: cytochrome C oxidase subunit IV family protein [Cytophagaceae bacterium]|nr:cytochrome C oxidase subunit IV family protein [Cytophagaceae bacterium]MDW8455627.1 cytochrome C oxidase subunit IV family protein [Cytophagaceae bacterium]